MAVISHSTRTGGKLPRGPHRLTSEQVAVDQRQRLIDAMLWLAGESGYAAATTVADVIERAEVSRKTFYAHFADRDELLLATFDATALSAFEGVRAASLSTGGPTRRIEAFMRRLCRVARESPSTIALSTIEIAAVDPAGLERRDRLIGDYGTLIDECLRSETKQSVMPSTLLRTLAGGVHRTIDAYLRAERKDELTVLARELSRWTRSHHPLPSSMGESASSFRPNIGSYGLLGGRAPGTLMLAANGYQPPRTTRSSGFVHHTNRERILDAVAQLVSIRGYTSLTAQSIFDHADLSERAFLAHFKNRDDAFAATVEIGHMKGQAIVERARSNAPDWRTGVRQAVCALLDFLASEPYFTRLAFVDAPLAGPAMTRRTHEHAGAYARLLLDGAPQRRRPPSIAPEAAIHGLFELAFHHAAQDEIAELAHLRREATYLVLAPFLGATEAAEVAMYSAVDRASKLSPSKSSR
jgi:AcrR family transcriptional regulator